MRASAYVLPAFYHIFAIGHIAIEKLNTNRPASTLCGILFFAEPVHRNMPVQRCAERRVIFISLLPFKAIDITDRAWITSCLTQSRRASLEYNFTSIFIWQHAFKLRAAESCGRLIVLSDPDNPSYLFPDSPGPIEPVVETLYRDAAARGVPLRFNVVLEEDKARLEQAYPNQFEFTANRDEYDYVYASENLITLKGRKLSSKRNHLNHFMVTYRDWAYEPITPQNIGEARGMEPAWQEENAIYINESLEMEAIAVDLALNHFFELGLTGGLLRVGGKAVAFTMGEPLNDTTYLVHIEKALAEYAGAYQMINREFAETNCASYPYINREDDAGDEGLRRAKLSYDPAFLVTKYKAQLIGDRLQP